MQFWRIVFGVGLGYAVLSVPGNWATLQYDQVSPIYAFTGFALVCTLYFGGPALLALFLAPMLMAAIAMLTAPEPITAGVVIQDAVSAGQLVIVAALGSALVKRSMGENWRTLTTEMSAVKFFWWGGLIAYLPSPSLTVAANFFTGVTRPEDIASQWLGLYLAGIFGIFVTAPLTLMVLLRREPIWQTRGVLIGIPLTIVSAILLTTFSWINRWEYESIQTQIEREGEKIREQFTDRLAIIEAALMGGPSARSLRIASEIIDVQRKEPNTDPLPKSKVASSARSPQFELWVDSTRATIDLTEFIKAVTRGILADGLIFSLEMSSGERLFFEAQRGPTPKISLHSAQQHSRFAEPAITQAFPLRTLRALETIRPLEFRRGNEVFRLTTHASDAYWRGARRYVAWQITTTLWMLVAALQILALGLTGRKTLIQNKDQELLAQKTRLVLADKVMQNTSEAITVLDADGALISVNPAFTKITGFSPEDVLGHRLVSLRAQHQTEGFFESIFEHLDRHSTWSGEIWGERKDQGGFVAFHTLSVVRDEQGRIVNYIDAFSDITARKREQAQIEFLAFNDALTQLPNRVVGHERLTQAVSHAKRIGCKAAALYIDIDHFKLINDTYGHATGDQLLQGVAKRMRETLRQEDTLCRLSGDEFLIVLYELSDPGAVVAICEKIASIMTTPFVIADRELAVTLSIGAALYPDDGDNTDSLLQNADIALNEVKKRSRNNYRLYSMDLSESLTRYVDTARDLRQAIDREEFQLVYQPQVSLDTGRIVCVEALVRWAHPERGLLSPGEFITVAEESGLIAPLGEWILHQACEDAARWSQDGLAFGKISINMSALQFDRAEPIELIMQTLRRTGLPASQLDVEITESVMVKNVERMAGQLTALKRAGISVSIDDFGIGYSSLSYLKKLSVDRIKIDQSFVTSLDSDLSNQSLVKAIVDMSHSLGIRAVAEGIETSQVLQVLKTVQCDEGQGYLFARPMSAPELEVYLTARGT